METLLNTEIDDRKHSFEKEDFYYQLTPDELKSLAIAEEQSKLGMIMSSEEVRKEVRERYASKLGNRG
ncbi:MAG: hypothetical protein ACFNUO_06900 [Capnocytophaga ochracea]|jgi:hypothetical protein|uniref:Uncharacterized protein n=1 Tax=Capnocytophaga ochracea TaxID=1018 RepID=A0A2X2REY1_CAPOC|nr:MULTISPECIES: hypothetical protein [Capnocytophaga]EKY05421.1 hypothetical protein HMPREF9078_01834 [Capnocytophaga sp. oral taxon 380 str. F0488]QLF49817.1 hypothetical protein HW278_03415 [Capnocytophaga sp. oral taxon 902]UZD36243.1 hypothetical protein OLG90_11210 [Capnocytophaga ochracea]UZD40384.1 hypothetical protein OL231_09425 [Capnocytophaga ochracea]SQA77714.1 Uncharacterised protein [Capnocytophaga ochracea]